MSTSSADTANWLNARLTQLQNDRVNFDTVWERITRLVRPSMSGFRVQYAPGTNRSQDVFDSTAQYAAPRFAAAIDTLITPQTSKWHQLRALNPALRGNSQVARALSEINDTLFAVRYSPKGNFASRAFEVYLSLGIVGNGVLYIHDAKPGIRYMSIHLSEIYIDENAEGVIDTAFWTHEYSQRQAFQKWGDKLPEDILRDAKENPGKLVKFCTAVFPRVERNTARKDNRNMPFASYTFRVGGDSTIVEESGYRTFPFAVARYTTAARETMGRGPAHECLADNLTLQEMEKTNLRFGQLTADPPLLATDADSLDPFVVRPGSINYGYLSPDGNEMVKPMSPKGDTRLTFEMQQKKRDAINASFLITLFQVLTDNGSDRMTATEVMQRVQEKGALLAPIGGRLRTEFLGPMIERELDILFNAGVIRVEDLPPELMKDGRFEIEYDSPLTRAMKADEGVGILRTVDLAVNIAQADPTVVKRLDFGRILERIADINGAPPDILFSVEEMAMKQQAEQQQAMVQQAVAAAPGVSQAVKNFAQAQQISQNAPIPGNTTGVI